MYKQVLLTAYEAYQATNIHHVTWENKSFTFHSLVTALSFAKEHNKDNGEFVLFLNIADLGIMSTSRDFADHFDPVSHVEVTKYGYLGKVCAIDVYQTPNKEPSQLRERSKNYEHKEALRQFASLIETINNPNFNMAEQQPN